MFDHVKFGVSDYAASKACFLKARLGRNACGSDLCLRFHQPNLNPMPQRQRIALQRGERG